MRSRLSFHETAVKPLKSYVSAGIGRLGYAIHRVPPCAADPRYAIEFDFDYVLAHYLAIRTVAGPPSFLQVGAYDGVTHDPINAHVRREGWNGILVEPQPLAFDRLKANYADVSGLAFVNAAIASEPGPRALFVLQDEAGSLIESLGGLASLNRARLERFMDTDGRLYPGVRIGSLQVRCTTFQDVLSETPSLDLLLIDAEGFDLELLKLFDFQRFLPAIVRFEHVHLSTSDWNEAVELLARHGYRTLREEHDTTAYLDPRTAGATPQDGRAGS